jgi:hypothetical protein
LACVAVAVEVAVTVVVVVVPVVLEEVVSVVDDDDIEADLVALLAAFSCRIDTGSTRGESTAWYLV